MMLEEFYKSLGHASPPQGIPPLLLALWYDANGDWQRSHAIAQDIEGRDGALIHAYLHRKEGDLWNADYWYRQAGTARPVESLAEEFRQLVQSFTVSQS